MLSQFAELLLQILHRDPTRPDPETLVLFTPAEWEALIEESGRLRLDFQLRNYLQGHPDIAARVPAPGLQRLGDRLRQTKTYNFCKQLQLEEMLSACTTDGIPCLVMKGLWLVEILYRDLQARHSGDIDLLVCPRDMPAFTRLAQRLGFQVPSDIGDLREISAANNQFPLFHPGTGASFDLHWSLTLPLEEAPVDDLSFWDRSEGVILAGQPCRCLGLEDHLLFMCFHATLHHRFQGVGPRALVDIAQIITASPRAIDWGDFVACAQDLGWGRGTWLILDLVREYLGVEPPPGVLDGLSPDQRGGPAVRQAALATLCATSASGPALGGHEVRLMSAATRREGLAILWGRLFPPRRYVASYFGVTLGYPGLPWLYVKRWGMLVKRVTPGWLQLWRGKAGRRAELRRAAILADWLQQP